jgi:hypothetical protein
MICPFKFLSADGAIVKLNGANLLSNTAWQFQQPTNYTSSSVPLTAVCDFRIIIPRFLAAASIPIFPSDLATGSPLKIPYYVPSIMEDSTTTQCMAKHNS